MIQSIKPIMNSRQRISILVLFFVALNPSGSWAQSAGYIYGKVLLKNGQSYQGQLRWDDREAMWSDIFDAYKADRPYQNLLSDAESKKLKAEGGDFKFGFMELWEDRNPDFSFMFRCSFGDIEKLESIGDNLVSLRLKNGHKINLKEDGGDIDDDITVIDNSLGRQKFKFSNVKSILFSSTPESYRSPMGKPVYGKIMTSSGIYQGYITWDREECLANDIISGKQEGQLLNLKFGDIVQIKAQRDGSLIILKSGKELFLNDHDDVDDGNHGIAVRELSFGTIEVDWEHFISATFFTPEKPAKSYPEFKEPNLLRATTRTVNGAKLVSQIVFDLDEIYDIEFLNGANGGFTYYIPFSLVTTIEPQNDKFSAVSVRSGEQFLLGDSGDVNIQNNGLILKYSENNAQFLEWNQVKSIQFD